MNILAQQVLKLNRLWQVIGTTTVEEAIKQAAIDVATFMFIEGDVIQPTRWDDWLKLPVVEADGFIRTQHLQIRRPTVMICLNYDRVPRRRPKFTLANIAKRDGGRCQYTGKMLPRSRWSLDHVLPKSRGGKDAPDNVVLADRDVNNKKGNRTPEECGLPTPKIRKLSALQIEPTHPHHELFLRT